MSFLEKIPDSFFGVSPDVLETLEGHQTFRSVMFKPYTSFPDVFKRTAAIITAPPLLTLSFSIYLIKAGLELLASAINRFSGDIDSSSEKFDVAKNSFIVARFFLLLIPISLLLEPIDVIGSIFTTLSGKNSESTSDYSQDLRTSI